MSDPEGAALVASRRGGVPLRDDPCPDCTGDGGTGHTMRGACGGAPCAVCGHALYAHDPGECLPKEDDRGPA